MKVITLDESDDIVSICDRLIWANAKRVLFELRGDVRLERLDLVRLRRFAERERVEVGLVTAVSDIIRQAQAVGIPTFSSVEAAKQDVRQWRRGRIQKEPIGLTRPAHPSPSKTTPSEANPVSSRTQGLLRLGAIFAILVFVALFYAGFIVSVPRATIQIMPETRPLQASQAIDLNSGLTSQTNQLFQELSSQVPQGFTLVADSLAVVQEGDKLLGTGVAAANINLDAVMEQIAGQDVETAVSHLHQELPLQAAPSVEIWPVWFKRIPYRAERIQIERIIE